ncbi:twin-arginine translocation signal domain-containing protein [Roseibacterium sp. SDUM158016]|jgi:hypothetical protein|uniref:twin-arginine translocation signal domain-containing protein n=1 Tax=Roseicyclus sediminis TaxID=2980997 RepID=UPI0021CE94EE|nr:twin-arginine translocation signal domain-containing protein [Roseibacterium sp. SDUM158016]MCU4653221.1 twin-arginine translocation signal domain-containing protein [Roseibacterium sp. SDUM158016]
MPELTRRGFLAALSAAGAARALPPALARLPARRILTLVRDKATGGLRAVDRLVP